MLRGFLLPGSSTRHVRAFTLSRALRLLASSAAVLCLLEPAVVELFFLCRGLHGAFVLLLSAPTCSGPCAVVWNTCTRHFCCSVTPLLLSVLVQTALSTSSAASGRCSRIFPSRGLVELLRSFSNVFPTCFCRRRRFTATASSTPFCRGVLTERVTCALRLLTWPSASRARHRLSVTFEMLGLCCCSDAMSSSACS